MLGIVIGVAAVIAMLAVGKGAKDAINSQISALGTNVVMVIPGAFTQSGVRQEAGTSSRLTEDDVAAISKCPSVLYVSPLARTTTQVKYGNQNWRTSINGVYPHYLDIRDWPVSSGTSFSDGDERGATKVCLLGQTVVTNLFGTQSPIGAVIRIGKLPFTVVGVLSAKGQNAMGQDQDDAVIAPFSTIQKKLLGATYIGTIVGSAAAENQVDMARQEINQALMGNARTAAATASIIRSAHRWRSRPPPSRPPKR